MLDSDKLKNDLDNLRNNIDIFNYNINNIIHKLKKVSENIEIYYQIYNNLISIYQNKKRNYELYQNLKNISNNNILKDICDINKEYNINNKIKNILEIYRKMIFDEIVIKYNIKKKDDTKGIKIFGKGFIINNKEICKIIYEDKEYELQEYIDIKNLNKDLFKLKGISEITNMFGLFHKCNSLSSISDLSKWDTSYITNMNYLF